MQISQSITENWKRLSETKELPDYALHYFDSLKAQFRTMPNPSKSGAQDDVSALDAYTEAKSIAEKSHNELVWTDLMLLDMSLIRLISINCLVFKVAELRHRLAGCSVPLPPELTLKLDTVDPSRLAVLRCEAEMLVTQLWQVRMARNSRERYVGELRRTVLQWLIGVEFLIIIIPTIYGLPVPLFMIILAAGMLGALTSILRRIQAAAEAISINLDQNSDLSALAYEKRAIVISLLMGGVFAMVLYIAFIAGLSELSGNLAPEFTMPDVVPEDGVNFHYFADLIGPATGGDYAKIVLWSFVAGFFEQLVPDVLDRLVKKDKKP